MSQRREDSSGLTPIVYRDFTGGLYELGHERGIPSNALLECTDFMPLPSGGLRAAWAWLEEPLHAVPTNRRVTGFQVNRGGINRMETGALQIGLMLASTSTSSTGPFTYEYWTVIQSTLAGSTRSTWNAGPTHSSMRRLFPTHFRSFRNETDGVRWYYNIAASDTAARTQRGLFRLGIELNSIASTQVFNENVAYFTAHQDRLVLVRQAITGTTAGISDRYDRLAITNPTTDGTPPSSNRLDIGIYRDGTISWLDAVFPQDLFILKSPQAGFAVQGDIGGGPLVREVITNHLPERLAWGVRTPGGFAYLTETQGVWLWSGGQDHAPLSKQILGSPMTDVVLFPPGFTDIGVLGNFNLGFLGVMGYGNRWLFSPKGYIMDLENGFWFRSTLPKNNVYSQWSYDEMGGRMYAAGHKEPGSDVTIISASVDERNMVRASSASATLPLLDTQERSIQIRYIEVFGQGFSNGGTWQLELTNSKGETELTPLKAVPARAASARFDTKLQGDWLKIRVLSQGNPDATQPVTQASEAPMIDRIVVWARPKTRRV